MLKPFARSKAQNFSQWETSLYQRQEIGQGILGSSCVVIITEAAGMADLVCFED